MRPQLDPLYCPFSTALAAAAALNGHRPQSCQGVLKRHDDESRDSRAIFGAPMKPPFSALPLSKCRTHFVYECVMRGVIACLSFLIRGRALLRLQGAQERTSGAKKAPLLDPWRHLSCTAKIYIFGRGYQDAKV